MLLTLRQSTGSLPQLRVIHSKMSIPLRLRNTVVTLMTHNSFPWMESYELAQQRHMCMNKNIWIPDSCFISFFLCFMSFIFKFVSTYYQTILALPKVVKNYRWVTPVIPRLNLPLLNSKHFSTYSLNQQIAWNCFSTKDVKTLWGDHWKN